VLAAMFRREHFNDPRAQSTVGLGPLLKALQITDNEGQQGYMSRVRKIVSIGAGGGVAQQVGREGT
jgi:hypothetical protein